jgi:hypothetical protein
MYVFGGGNDYICARELLYAADAADHSEGYIYCRTIGW